VGDPSLRAFIVVWDSLYPKSILLRNVKVHVGGSGYIGGGQTPLEAQTVCGAFRYFFCWFQNNLISFCCMHWLHIFKLHSGYPYCRSLAFII